MEIQEGKQKFIEAWGRLAGSWSIPPAMAQMHALLMISPEPLTADQIKEALEFSTGNVSMNLRALMEWGLVYRETRPSERKDVFVAERDMWKVARQIIINRKKRELEPMLQILDELACVQEKCPHSEHFCNVIQDIRKSSHKANQTLDSLTKAEPNWIHGLFLRMMP
ncbi:MAG: ArsR family transcriptional regulator [Saprospiraceae bacterium]|nr:ArsR family transcriptional regulator [Saprospiraceae bacterium]